MVNSCGITPAKHHSCTMINHGNVGKLECYSGYLTMVYYGILWFYHSILWFYHSVLWCFFKHSLHFTIVISKVWYHVDFRYKNMVISWYIWKYHGRQINYGTYHGSTMVHSIVYHRHCGNNVKSTMDLLHFIMVLHKLW